MCCALQNNIQNICYQLFEALAQPLDLFSIKLCAVHGQAGLVPHPRKEDEEDELLSEGIVVLGREQGIGWSV